MVGLAGASVPLVFLISMVGMVATASSLAQFATVYPSAGSFLTYITRAIGTRVAVAVGVITIIGYITAFGGIYIFVGSYIAQNVFGGPHVWGLTQLITIVYGVLVVAPVVVGLRFGVRVTVVLYAFEVILLLAMSITILARGGTAGLSAAPFKWPGGTTDVLLTFSLAVLAFGGFEAAAPLAEETRNPRRNVPIAVIGAVVLAIPVWGDLRPGQPSPYSALPWLTLALIAVGIVYACVLGQFRPNALASAPALLEGASDDTPDAGVP